jgi:hypothetical protein
MVHCMSTCTRPDGTVDTCELFVMHRDGQHSTNSAGIHKWTREGVGDWDDRTFLGGLAPLQVRRIRAGALVESWLDIRDSAMGQMRAAHSVTPYQRYLDYLTDALIERRAAVEAKESCMVDGCQHPRRGTSYCSLHADKARIWGLSS